MSVGMKLVLIPAGEFMMGSSDEQIATAKTIIEQAEKAYHKTYDLDKLRLTSETPQHRIVLTRPYLMGAAEVTVAQFRTFVEATKYVTEAEQFGGGSSKAKIQTNVAMKNLDWRTPKYAVTEEMPVTQVSWNDAVAFCNWLSNSATLKSCYKKDTEGNWTLVATGDGYRLPTEAEWESACRAGTTTQFSFGDEGGQLRVFPMTEENQKAYNYTPNAVGTTSPPNAFGLLDMHGNVSEWCHDGFAIDYYHKMTAPDPFGPKANDHVLRGGSFASTPVHLRSAFRYAIPPISRYPNYGFRVVRVALESPANDYFRGLQKPSGDGKPDGSSDKPVARPLPMRKGGLAGWQAARREELIKLYGGDAASEAAVTAGLTWLARQQMNNGGWSLKGPYSSGSEGENQKIATALAVLAFMGHGNTHWYGPYQSQVIRGIDFIRTSQDFDGNFYPGSESSFTDLQYRTQSLGTIALAELYRMTKDPSLLPRLERAILFCTAAQTETGGWGIQAGAEANTHETGWMMLALETAKLAGLNVQPATLTKVREYLDKCTKDGILYSEQAGSDKYLMIPPALSCRQYLAWQKTDTRLVQGAGRLLRTLPDWSTGRYDLFWYQATQFMHDMDGDYGSKWGRMVRDMLVKNQTLDGKENGSWAPSAKGLEASRLYVTCLALGSLEASYRHLPFYSQQKETDGSVTPPPTGKWWLVAPFDAIQSAVSCQAWAKYLNIETETTNSIGMRLTLVPPGKFEMGPLDTKEPGQHPVGIVEPLYLSTREVTKGQFAAFVAATNYQTDAEKDGKGGSGYNVETKALDRVPDFNWRNTGWDQTDDHPVVNVSWHDVMAFCEWLSQKEGKTYRLPTEAQWEYACLAGAISEYATGDEAASLAGHANVQDASFKTKFPKGDFGSTPGFRFDDGWPFTAPVGKFHANALGLYDMNGNVWEWCATGTEMTITRSLPSKIHTARPTVRAARCAAVVGGTRS